MASERHKLAESNIACKKIKIRISSGAVSAWRPECNMLQARVVRTQPYGTHTALHLLKVMSAKCKKNTKRNHHPIMEDLADLICFLFSFLQVCFLARVWLCVSDPVCPGFVLLPLLPVASCCSHPSLLAWHRSSASARSKVLGSGLRTQPPASLAVPALCE